MKKIVIGLSGGMDSATLLGLSLAQGYEVHCCTFYYGSKHGKWENRAAEEVIDFYLLHKYPVIGHVINLEGIFTNFQSNLLNTGGEIPEGHYKAETMEKTAVPGRNMIFASIMAGLAESIEADSITLAVHAGDHHIYPDCRLEFIKALDSAIYLSSDKKIQVHTPFINDTKVDILRKGLKYNPNVPYEYTRTCYKNQALACGKCGSCTERLEAFEKLHLKDPIKYE